MKLERFEELNARAAQAASLALARIASAPVAIVASARPILAAAPPAPRHPERSVVAVRLSLTGLSGGALLCFPERLAHRLSEGRPAIRSDQMRRSFLKEVGNIICGAYVSVLANALGLRIVPGLPRLEHGLLGPIVEALVGGCACEPGDGLLVEVEIAMSGHRVAGELIVVMPAERVLTAR